MLLCGQEHSSFLHAFELPVLFFNLFNCSMVDGASRVVLVVKHPPASVET